MGKNRRPADMETGGRSLASGGLAAKAHPMVAVGLLVLQVVGGIVFIAIGSVSVNKCQMDEVIPIWLILMGIVFLVTGIQEYLQWVRARKLPQQGRGAVGMVVSLTMTVLTIGLFIMGNVVVYRAWGNGVQFGQEWWSNGCEKLGYMTAFAGIIFLDVMFGLMVVGIVFYAIHSCCC